MQLVCPACGSQVPTEHINIHKMAAACPVCNTVFQFDTPEVKPKRRKVKQPNKLILRDTDEKLHMEFRTNFRLDRNQAFRVSLFAGVGLTILMIIQLGQYLAGEGVLFLLLLLPLVAILHFYRLSLLVYNRTHIDMDEKDITVSRQPLPSLSPATKINLSGVVAFHSEETATSIKEAYDTPRYRVMAEYADGSRRIIVNDMVEDYGYFIAQRLEERLELDEPVVVAQLEDSVESKPYEPQATRRNKM